MKEMATKVFALVPLCFRTHSSCPKETVRGSMKINSFSLRNLLLCEGGGSPLFQGPFSGLKIIFCP